MRRYTFALMAVLLVLFPWHQSLRADAAHYTVENLGSLGGLVPTITGINAAGQVSGYVQGPSGPRAVRFTNGHGWEILQGLDNTFSLAFGINASGDLAGYYFNPDGALHAFRYRGVDAFGVVDDIAPLAGGFMSFGFAINGAGDVVGYSYSSIGTTAFVAHRDLPAIALPSLGANATACGINDAGQIAGSSPNLSGVQHAFRLDPGATARVEIGSFNGPGGFSAGCAIDGDGHVGGQADGVGGTHAFRFERTLQNLEGTLQNLDATFGSSLGNTESIAAGTSVGWFLPPSANTFHAFVHTDADGSNDLNTLLDNGAGWLLTQAKAVAADGTIAGQGTFNGATAVFRLTKVAATADTTPPAITSLSANPSSITPPNDAMVPVQVAVTAVDSVDPSPVCAISGIDTHGAPSSFASLTGPLTASVRAAGSALYSFAVRCADASGNASTSSVDVVVPPDTTAPVFTSLTATPSVIYPPKGQNVTVTTAATATDDSGQTPVCKLANITGPGTAPTDFNVTGANTGTVRAVGGRTYTFNELCVDASNNVAWSSVNVTVPPDTTAPVIASVTASPSTIWPPNDALVAVSVLVSATDDVDDAPVCALTSISATAMTADDYAITGPLTAKLRAVGGRTYTLIVRCSDVAGNSSNGSTAVVVPPDTTAPVISGVFATPSAIWPPNGKWVPVVLTVNATDDVDANPSCSLTSVTGAPATDYMITGALTASVRADLDPNGSARVYSLNVSCSDRARNTSTASTSATVTKDAQQPAKASVK